MGRGRASERSGREERQRQDGDHNPKPPMQGRSSTVHAKTGGTVFKPALC
jgi:hypothetical protein